MASSAPRTSPEYSSTFDYFDIELDAGKDAVFHGGELVTGFLKVKLKRPMTIEIIRLHFKGRGCFIERDGSKHEEKDKIYFDKDLTLLERPPGKPEPGHFPWIAEFMYSLPFECTLPIGCPTSYETVFGFIRYFVRAVIEEANTKNQFVAKRCFTVVAPLSSDEEIPESNPVTATEALTQGGCCCRTKISAEAQLQRSVFSPGEKVIGTLKVGSKHQKKLLDMIEVKLVDRLGKIDGGKTRYAGYRSILSRKLDPKEFHSSTLEFFKVPSVAPSLLGRSIEKVFPNDNRMIESPSTMTLRARKKPFLRIEYEVQISIGGKLLLQLPITIVAPGKDRKYVYEPFIAGAQFVDDSDEMEMHKADDQGFTFTPLYPVATELSENSVPTNMSVSTREPDGLEPAEQLKQLQEAQLTTPTQNFKQDQQPEKLHRDQDPVEAETLLRQDIVLETTLSSEVHEPSIEKYETLVLTKEAGDIAWQPLKTAESQHARQASE